MLFGLTSLSPKNVFAQLTPGNEVIFSEVFPGNPSPNAGQEFIELYNNTDQDIDLTGWHVQYTSASKTDWTSPSRNIALSGTIASQDYYLLASSGYLGDKSALTFSAALAQTGGHLRLLDNFGALQDQIGWGNALMPLGVAIEAPDAGNSLARLANDEGYNLTLDNSSDYAQTTTSTPGEENTITTPQTDNGDGDSPGQTNQPPSTTPPVTTQYSEIQISEILPNPKSPQTDANDEFVELYNPNDGDVDLSGYIIETGITTLHKYPIAGVTIPAGGYYVFTSGDSSISLSNSSGQVKLLAPDNSLIDQSDAYANAPEGESWIFSGGNWTWTASLTPGADNIFTAPPVKAPKVKAASIKKATTKKAKRAAVKKAKKQKTQKPLSTLAATQKPPAKVHPVVLASVGSGALLYAMYEYRTDLGGGFYRFRRYRETWGADWFAPASAAVNRALLRFRRWQDYLRSRLGSWLGQ